jgi:hypothetical protein
VRIELRETGGIANLDRSIVLDGDQLERIDKGAVKAASQLGPDHIEQVSSLLEELDREQPRKVYGGSPVSDGMQSVLSYSTESGSNEIRVLSDPSDSPPEQFRALRTLLHSLARPS